MNGHVFECFHEQADRKQFKKTLEALDQYVKKNLQCPEQDLTPLFTDSIGMLTLDKPKDIEKDAEEVDKAIWNEEIKEYVRRKRELRSNMVATFAVAWSQCLDAMKAKIKNIDEYKTKSSDNDCTWLLQQIRVVTLQFDSKRNPFLSLLDAWSSFLLYKQGQHQTNDSYLATMHGWVETIKSYGGTMAENVALIPKIDKDGNERDEATQAMLARDKTLAVALIHGADLHHYRTLIQELANATAMGVDNYPRDMTAAYGRLLVNYKTPWNLQAKRTLLPANDGSNQDREEGLMFAQQGGPVPGTNGVTHNDIECFKCHQIGHYASNSPDEGKSGVLLIQCTLTQSECYNGIPKTWILLDTESNVSVFNNPKFVTDIRQSNQALHVKTNGGYQVSTMIAMFHNLGQVWFNTKLIANILSLAQVCKVCCVTMDTNIKPAMCVHQKDGTVMKFVEHAQCGLVHFQYGRG